MVFFLIRALGPEFIPLSTQSSC